VWGRLGARGKGTGAHLFQRHAGWEGGPEIQPCSDNGRKHLVFSLWLQLERKRFPRVGKQGATEIFWGPTATDVVIATKVRHHLFYFF